MAQRAAIGRFCCFLGIPASRMARPEHADNIRFFSYCGTSANDAGFVVTEFGVADLRRQPLSVRRERMIAIAHPDHRRILEQGAERKVTLR